MREYLKQAQDFLKETTSTLIIKFEKRDVMPNFGDNTIRNIYKCTFEKNGKQFTIKFGDSINNTKKGIKPNEYDILSCLQKYDVGSFSNFCNEFGYLNSSKRALRIYNACKKEYEDLQSLYSEDEIEKMQEIQ